MSLTTGNENCSYYNGKDLSSIVFDICYFIGNSKYLRSNHGRGFNNQEIWSTCCCFWIEKKLYTNHGWAFSNWEIQSYWYHVLSPKFRANQNKRDCCLCFSIFWCTYWFWYITSFVKKTFVNNNCLVFQISKISFAK